MINSLKYKLWILMQNRKLRKREVLLGKNVRINRKTYFEGKNRVNDNVTLSGSKLGLSTYIGSDCYLVKCSIGKFCSIGSNISIVRGNHPAKVFVSTHPAFFSMRKQAGFTFVDSERFTEIQYANDNNDFCEIGNDVWIGNNVIIRQGITIHDGAVIGLGSVVLKDVEPFAIYGGVPAKKIGYRFTDDQISKLMEIKWWDRDLEWIQNASPYFNDIDTFLSKVENNEL